MRRLFIIITLFASIASQAFPAFALDAIERFALVAGSNSGGKGTGTLKYAASDAKRFQDLLVRMGGIKDENSLLLINPDKDSLARGLAFLQSKLRKGAGASRQAQFLFYFSGHSDERGLLLDGERMDYADLKSRITAVGAEVEIVILDSCSSGAFTRQKGGQIGVPFLQDLSSEVEGHAFITSSTADEVSQESDRIESSFFTHSLIEALRGAADSNADGTVTLNEAYAYAYDRTLAETERASGGTQHPAFDIKLNGKGNLVLTDIRQGGPIILFPKGLRGRVAIRDISNKLVVELAKDEERELSIRVEEGYYRVTVDEGGSLQESMIIADEAGLYRVSPETLKAVSKSATRNRGSSSPGLDWLGTGISISDRDGRDSLVLDVFGGQSKQLSGLMLSLVYGTIDTSSQGAQGAMFVATAAQDFTGAQFAGALDWTGGDFVGLQSALGGSLAKGDLIGLQLSAGFNWTGGDAIGGQASWLLNVTRGDFAGVQLGAFNFIEGTLRLGQIGLSNYLAQDGNFLQAGLLNQAWGEFTGLQVAYGLNLARNFRGIQLGFVNYADEGTGLQIGLVNISRKLTGLPIGIIDIQFNGQNHVDFALAFSGTGNAWDRNLVPTMVIRFGSEWFYKYFLFESRTGVEDAATAPPAISLGAGLGFRFPILLPGLALHMDAGIAYNRVGFKLDFRASQNDLRRDLIPQTRLFLSYRPVEGGPGLLAGFDQHFYFDGLSVGSGNPGMLPILFDGATVFAFSRPFLGIQL